MDFQQAKRLVELISQGKALGADPEGGIIFAPTSLSTALGVLGERAYIWRTGARGVGTKQWDVGHLPEFLREWAAALESEEPRK